MSDTPNTKSLAIIPRTFAECTAIAEHLSKSSLLPKEMRDKMPNVLVTIMAGQELGLSPMASLRNFHVIEGKPILSADGMVAVVLGSGKAAYVKLVEESSNDTSVTYETLRVGAEKPRRCTWTMEMAKRAALHQKDNWRLYQRQMLGSRAKAELMRDVYQDVLAGCYTDDEISTVGRPVYDAGDVIEAEIVSETPKPSLKERIEGAPDIAALDALVPDMAALTGKDLQWARHWYKERRTKLLEEARNPLVSSDSSSDGATRPTSFETSSGANTVDAPEAA